MKLYKITSSTFKNSIEVYGLSKRGAIKTMINTLEENMQVVIKVQERTCANGEGQLKFITDKGNRYAIIRTVNFVNVTNR